MRLTIKARILPHHHKASLTHGPHITRTLVKHQGLSAV
jgi:hypothetical protein